MSNYIVSSNLAISDSGFLFYPATGESFTLNQIGIFILNKLREGKDENAVIQSLVDEYDVDKNTAERDFTDFIYQLKQNNLVQES
ncbi:MAG: PqqD family protein [Melioribacteraceae bacterium]|nr:PqqD family protein [Melioribacteraceae bacterium]MCF8395500.1 PqqD family protein [Melioribacteraceae bacterium]MCF8420840.1 PqqD family protein [Melioribacteraceae bacterium]